MNLLVFNCGSSSQAFSVFRLSDARTGCKRIKIISGKARNVATRTQQAGSLSWKLAEECGSEQHDFPTHTEAAECIIQLLHKKGIVVDVIGHRFVHGGNIFNRTVKINMSVKEQLAQTFHLAPIHNPNSYSVIEVCSRLLPDAAQYAVFDNAFHAGMPDFAAEYAIPHEIAKEHGFRKYGFHGLSYQYVSNRIAALTGRPLHEMKLVLCHLGTGGSSVCAIQDGRSFDTSMGYSPLAGLIMSTRSGEIDPAVVLEMIRLGYTADQIDHLLNFESGILGLSGTSSNLQEVRLAAEAGNAACVLTWKAYVHRLRKTIGSFLYVLSGADALVFTDDVAVQIPELREAVCEGAESFGIKLDGIANRVANPDCETQISSADSRTAVWVIPNDEESVIADEIQALVEST